jgi:hypothetical protein
VRAPGSPTPLSGWSLVAKSRELEIKASGTPAISAPEPDLFDPFVDGSGDDEDMDDGS